MKILVFGNSHLGPLKGYFHQKRPPHVFFDSNTFDFVGVIGRNFHNITTSREKSEIILPKKFLSKGSGVKQVRLKESGTEINLCNFASYDVVIWAQGFNLIYLYHSIFGGTKEYKPAMLTRSLAQILFERIFKANKLLSIMRSESPNTRFLYTGQPLTFSYHQVVNKKRFANASSIHSRNINYLRDVMFETRKQLGLVMSPATCIHPSGLFSLEEFSFDIKQDKGHAGLNYGQHLWKEIIDLIE